MTSLIDMCCGAVLRYCFMCGLLPAIALLHTSLRGCWIVSLSLAKYNIIFIEFAFILTTTL